MQYAELRSHRRLALCKLPSFLSHLRSLRHLIVDRSSSPGTFNVYDNEQMEGGQGKDQIDSFDDGVSDFDSDY